jgi:hypothetical protein
MFRLLERYESGIWEALDRPQIFCSERPYSSFRVANWVVRLGFLKSSHAPVKVFGWWLWSLHVGVVLCAAALAVANLGGLDMEHLMMTLEFRWLDDGSDIIKPAVHAVVSENGTADEPVTMLEYVIWPYFVLCAVVLLRDMYIRNKHLLPTLRQHGVDAPEFVSLSRSRAQLVKYVELCQESGLPDTHWRYLKFSGKVLPCLVAGWLLLILWGVFSQNG